MNPLAKELNDNIAAHEAFVLDMLAPMGQALFFPKGILSQTAEAKQKAKRFNATIGIAKEEGHAMYLPVVMDQLSTLSPDNVLPYAPSPGLPALRQKWKESMIQKNPSLEGKPISLPVVTSGITHGISLVADLFAGPGDVVLMPDMYWGNYNLAFAVRHGARIEKYSFFKDNGYNVNALREAIADHKPAGKLIISLNFPNNPSGYAVTTAEAQAIADVLVEAASQGCNIIAVCDDAYFGLFYEDNVCPESVFGYLVGQHERLLAIKLDGATKEDFFWGMRVGFITFGTGSGNAEVYDALEKKTGGAIRGNISNCSHLSQTVMLKAMADPNYAAQKQEKRAVMKARALKVKEVLADPKFDSVWTMYPFNSGYFMCVQLKNLDAEAYRLRLLDEQGIGIIATGPRNIRIAFSCVEVEDIPALFDAMLECAVSMQGQTV